jgi:hypothetical protein
MRYPMAAKPLLLTGTVVEILKSVLLLRNRNRLPYSDGAVAVQTEEGPIAGYFQMLQMFQQEFNTGLVRVKQEANLAQLMVSEGLLGSDYSYYYTW